MKKLIAIMLGTLLFATTSYAETASSESVRKLMMKTGAGNMGEQMMEQMLPALKKMVPDAPDSFWQKMMKKINVNDIVDMTVPIYQKYLTQDEIDAMNEFYDSKAGKKLVSVQPQIMKESMAIGQSWGQKIAQDVLNEYKANK